MKTAEEIIQEYLDRGYGLESLRILAESREEPLGGQMLDVIGRLEASAATVPLAAMEESAAEVSCDEALFFVADDDGAADGESVDFDLMAETREEVAETPAGTEESVADIVIGESAGADVVAYKTREVDTVEPGDGAEEAVEQGHAALSFVSESAETGIWSRLWSKVSQSAPALAPSMAEEREMAAAPEVAPEPVFEDTGEEAAAPLFAEYVAEPVFEEEEEPVAEAEAEEPAAVMNDVGEEAGVMEEPVVEEMPVAEEPAFEEPAAEEAIAAGAEISADYIPDSIESAAAAPVEAEAVVEEAVKDVIEEAVEEQPAAEIVEEEPVAEIAEEPVAEIVEEPVAEEAVVEEPVAEEPVAEVEQAAENKVSRREKRRRERLEKKKAKRGKKNAVAELPEIVLTHSEESGILVPEVAEAVESAEVAEAAATADPEAEIAGSVVEEPVAAEAEEKFESLLAPETLAALSVHSFAFAASLAALSQSELARAAEIIEEDRRASLAIEQNNLEAALENVEEVAEETVEEEVSADNEGLVENNVILFRGTFGEAGVDADESEDAIGFEPCLRMLAAPECGESEAAEEEPAALDDASAPETESPMLLQLQAALERETALRSQLEEEYQARLDSFAARLLEAQELAAAGENRVAEKKAELDARCAVLDEMRKRLENEEAKQLELLRKVDEAAAAAQAKDGELARAAQTHEGLREEHGQLYREFEDLRKAYNEVVTGVMPGLQSERDDLAMTVERQCAKEQTLRAGLKSSRKRLAAGYILGAAACLMLVTLPVANWLRSGDDNRKLAVDHQLFSELRETLDVQVQQNVDAQTRILELERKITRARDEISKLDGRNKELAGLAAAQHSQGIAVFKPGDASASGTPTRAMTMALQATVPPGGKLHVNEVMDPAGSIEQLAMENSARNAAEARTQMAQAAGKPGSALSVSAVARTDAGSGSLRPQAQGRAAVRPVTAGVRPSAAPASDVATVTAKVKKGEGVAQVVYRVLNTRDPDVIAWVIEENKIRNDRRGNPLIQPNQELRLPREGRIGQAASAAGTKRR